MREEERVVLFNDSVSCHVYRASVVDESMRTVYLLREGVREGSEVFRVFVEGGVREGSEVFRTQNLSR